MTENKNSFGSLLNILYYVYGINYLFLVNNSCQYKRTTDRRGFSSAAVCCLENHYPCDVLTVEMQISHFSLIKSSLKYLTSSGIHSL